MGAQELLADLAGAGLTVMADGDRLVIRPASKLTDLIRAALREAKAEVLALLSTNEPAQKPGALDLAAVAWTDADIEQFLDRRARLIRWGWAEAAAEALADRLVSRDREADDRRTCAECRHGRTRRCPDAGPLPGDVLHRCGRFEAES